MVVTFCRGVSALHSQNTLFDILPMSKARGFYPLRHRNCASTELLVDPVLLLLHSGRCPAHVMSNGSACVSQLGQPKPCKLAIWDRKVVTFVMLYFVLAIVNVLFLTIHAIRMIMQKDKGYAKAITSEGIIATTFFAYGAWMLRWISLR